MLLAQAAQRIVNRLKDIDDVIVIEVNEGVSVKIANLGGIDFGILIDSSLKKHLAEQIADDFINNLMEPLVLQSCALEFVISAGIARYPEHGTTIAALINHSLDAINSYGSGAVVYSPEEELYTNERIALMSSLRDAVDNNELVLHVQPLIDLHTKKIHGGEVFIRWRHPDRGLIHPDQFIALAEQTGVIFSLTQWVLQQTVAQLKVLKDGGFKQKLSVNLGNTDLLQVELLETIEFLAAREGVDLNNLTLEIKEAALLADPDKAYPVLMQIHQRNIGISIDDFGTGYTSLNYLRKFPINEVKIDCSLVTELSQSATNAAITRKLELDVVAVGIEDDKTAAKLRGMGCSKAQGYLYSKPFELNGFCSWITHWDATSKE
ncbi:MAG: EAL domain-containing protein (putative c-di-GMP-specific phosphodiesterase class I) [Alteromonadaceae bacterium]